LSLTGYSQGKSTKQTKEQKKAEQAAKIEALMNSREFTFVGATALPTGGRQVNLATNTNYLKFQPEMIDSQMPYFGRAYSTSGYGTDAGMKFKGKPDEFRVEKTKKGWDVNATVTDQNDKYTIYLSVTASGSAHLNLTSGRQSSISYNGEIFTSENK